MAAPQLPNQLPPGMASFNQGFKSIGDLMNQIQQHQMERQRLMEAVKQHADMMKFKQSEEDRAQKLFGPKLNSLNQKNALMEWVMNNMPNQDGQNVKTKGLSNPSEGLSENNSPAIGGPQSSQEGMNDPSTGILGGGHQVDMSGNPISGQDNQPQQPNQPTPEFMAKYQLATGHAYPKPYESPQDRRNAEMKLSLDKLKQESEYKNQRIYSEMAPRYKASLDALIEAEDITKNNPDIFGHANKERFMRISTNPKAGRLNTGLIPAILETDIKASKQGGKFAVQFAESKYPSPTDSQQVASGKISAAKDVAERNYAMSLQYGKIPGTTRVYRGGKSALIPNSEVLDFLEQNKNGHLYDSK